MRESDKGCGCEKTRRRWRAIRALLFIAGLSLVAYMPYKAATQYSQLQNIYGPWFLQGAVVGLAGILFAVRPDFATRLPLLLRLGTGAAAMLWIRTGLACTPSLMKTLDASLLKGGFAWFHMGSQHVFLSLGVLAFCIAPIALASRMGVATASVASADPVPDSA